MRTDTVYIRDLFDDEAVSAAVARGWSVMTHVGHDEFAVERYPSKKQALVRVADLKLAGTWHRLVDR